MLNPRSPIVNQLIGGGYQQYPPNNFPIGYNGYNQQGYTGYYGNQVNYNYYNPIYQQNMLRQQQEEAEKQRKQQIEFNKRLSRIAHAEDNSTLSEETLNKIYDPVSTQTPQQVAEQYEFNRIASLAQSINNPTPTQESITIMNRAKAATDYHNKFIDPKCGLNEFLNSAGNLYVDGLLRDEKHKNRDLSGTYDSKSYKQLLNRQAPYAGKFSNNIDDNVVTLPPHLQNKLKSTYDERRAQFLASIMNSKGGNPNG